MYFIWRCWFLHCSVQRPVWMRRGLWKFRLYWAQMALTLLIAISWPKKDLIFRAHPFQWSFYWILSASKSLRPAPLIAVLLIVLSLIYSIHRLHSLSNAFHKDCVVLWINTSLNTILARIEHLMIYDSNDRQQVQGYCFWETTTALG